MELAVFDLDSRQWVWRGSVPLGDRTRIRVLAVDGKEVIVQVTQHGDGDPMCYPTQRAERRFHVVQNGLEEFVGGGGAAVVTGAAAGEEGTVVLAG